MVSPHRTGVGIKRDRAKKHSKLEMAYLNIHWVLLLYFPQRKSTFLGSMINAINILPNINTTVLYHPPQLVQPSFVSFLLYYGFIYLLDLQFLSIRLLPKNNFFLPSLAGISPT